MSRNVDAAPIRVNIYPRHVLRFFVCLPGLIVWSTAAYGAIRWLGGLVSGGVTPGVGTSQATLYFMWGSVVLGALVAYVCAYLTTVRTMRLHMQGVIFLAACVGFLLTVGD